MNLVLLCETQYWAPLFGRNFYIRHWFGLELAFLRRQGSPRSIQKRKQIKQMDSSVFGDS